MKEIYKCGFWKGVTIGYIGGSFFWLGITIVIASMLYSNMLKEKHNMRVELKHLTNLSDYIMRVERNKPHEPFNLKEGIIK